MPSKKITTEEDLKAAVIEFYKYAKQAADEKPEGIFYRNLERAVLHSTRMLEALGIDPKTII